MYNSKKGRLPRWAMILIGIAALALIVGAIVTVSVISRNEYHVELSMKGEAEITLEYGEDFTDPGAEAVGYGTVFQKEHQTLDVDVEGEVDPDKLGAYTLTYTASFKNVKETTTRKVTIVDTVAPEITLVSDPDAFTIPGQEYQEEGFTATDNYDGEITGRVERKVEGDTVTYTVTDSSGNRTEVTRTIVFKDPEPPQLVLKGESKITITAGTQWVEPGYTATDNVDGDLTASVKIIGSVDIYIAGTYELTYEVTDNYGNKTTAKRTVVVEAVRQPDVVEPETSGPNGKVIYLTFDDGPGRYTQKLLGILEKYNVKATFFVCRTGYLDLLDDIVNAGHSIGIHSLTHKFETIYTSEEAFFEDLHAMQDIIFERTGVKTTLMRFPGGTSNSVSKKLNQGIMTRLAKAVEDQGFQYFDWNVDSNDAGGAKTAEEVFQNVINGIQKSKKNQFFVLQHDIQGFSVDAVERIILWGLNNGYTFLPLDPTSPACHHNPVN